MDNLISVFFDYKINCLVDYGVVIYNEDSKFIKQVFRNYFRTYIDNYYYGIFNTVEDERYNKHNLDAEFEGMMIEMLEDYRAYELQVSNMEYSDNRNIIKRLKDISLEIVKIDGLFFRDKDDILETIKNFINNNSILFPLIGNRVNKLVSLVKDNYINTNKILELDDNYFSINKKKFMGQNDIYYISLDHNIKALNVYKNSLVTKVFKDKKLDIKKLELLLQKISLYVLRSVVLKKTCEKIVVEISDEAVYRGKFTNKVMALIDNPLFRKYVILGIDYNSFMNIKDAFSEDYLFACIQDFSHINDIYTKTDTIYKEGTFNYLIVSKCRSKDINYFLDYEAEGMNVLVFEEE